MIYNYTSRRDDLKNNKNDSKADIIFLKQPIVLISIL